MRQNQREKSRSQRVNSMEQKVEIRRVRRVGSITTGITMIAGGILFILCGICKIISYEMIFRLWPVILIGLGIEILWFNAREKNLIYDKGAIAMLIMMAFFSMGMAVADMVITRCSQINW